MFFAAPLSARGGEGVSATAVPAPSGIMVLTERVTDLAAVLSPDEHSALTKDLASVEARTRHQIVVATVPSLGGRDISAYARDLGNKTGVGDKERDDGVVILLAPNERLIRIAVGLGLESVLTDALCQQIIDEVMIPHFKGGKMFEGLSGAVHAISARFQAADQIPS